MFVEFNSSHYLKNILKICSDKKIKCNVYNVKAGYKESDLLSSLYCAKYMILLDNNISGLSKTIQKSISCNVPVFIIGNIISDNWDVSAIFRRTIEFESIGKYIPNDFENEQVISYSLDQFLEQVEQYKPREFVLKNI